jgi:hypothetical protein
VSDPTDIKALDEYLKGGSEISQRYRESGGEAVPPELDRRVLEQARAAVAGDKAKGSRAWLRWSAPVAVAASIVLAVAIVLESGVQQDPVLATKQEPPMRDMLPAPDDAPREQEQERDRQVREQPPQARQDANREAKMTAAPAAARETPQSVVPAAPPAIEAVTVDRRVSLMREEVRVNAPAIRPDASQPVSGVTVLSELPAVAATPQLADEPPPTLAGSVSAKSAAKAENAAEANSYDVSEVAITGTRVQRAPPHTAGPRNTINQSAFSSESVDSSAAAPAHEDPQQWLEEIRELRRNRKSAEADRQWVLFREAFPDYQVADDDRARRK